jgi:N6-adenosine-specific RNA methylase IME4
MKRKMVEIYPDQVFGEAREGFHTAGYELERAFQRVQKLLVGDEWKRCGPGYKDVNVFLRDVQIGKEFQLVADARNKLAKRIKELQPKASGRAIAAALNAKHRTVARAVVPNGTSKSKKVSKDNGGESAGVPNGTTSGSHAARLIASRDEGAVKRAENRAAYAQRVVEPGATAASLQSLIASERRFPVIYADPAWTFEVYSGEGKQRSAERHYDTMSLNEIAALPVKELAAEHCALFLWSVWPELPGALRIIEAWGFQYKTCGFLYVKQNKSGEGLFTGMGYWTRANSEPCLLATKGSPTRIGMDVPQVILQPVGEHSEKPEETRSRIERLIEGPYLELFGRREVDGWTVWGNEIGM